MRFVFLLLLCCFSFLVRVWNLGAIPSVLREEEIKTGLSALSLATSHISYREFFSGHTGLIDTSSIAPFATVVTVPFVALLGLSAWSVRLPSVLFGTLTVVVFFWLTQELDRLIHKKISILATFFLAFSPWHIQVSRVDAGVNMGLFFFVCGIYLLLKMVKDTPVRWWWMVPFVLSIFANYLFVIPSIMVICSFFLFFKKGIQRYRRVVFVGFFIGVLMVLPIAKHVVQFSTRQDATNLYWVTFHAQESKQRIERSRNSVLSQVLFASQIEDLRLFIQHGAEYLEPQQLFVKWTHNPTYMMPAVGFLYPIDIVFFLVGLFFLFEKHPRVFLFLLVFAVSAVLPVAFTRSSPEALFAVSLIPPLLWMTAYGVEEAKLRVRKKMRPLVLIILMVSISYFFVRFRVLYFFEYPRLTVDQRSGYIEALSFANAHVPTRQHIWVVDDTYGKNLSLYGLFLKKTLPNEHLTTWANYTFLFNAPDRYDPNDIYIEPTHMMPPGAAVSFTSSSLEKAFRVSVFTTQ